MGDTLFVGSEDFFVYALDARNGAVRWKYETGLGISSSPAATGDMVYIGSKDGFVYALGTKTGDLKWKTRTEVVTSPLVFSEGVVYVQSSGTMALDGATGKMLWRAGLGGSVQGAPVVAEGVIYVAGNSGEVYALE